MLCARAAVMGLSLMLLAAGPPDLLQRERWHRRVLVMFAPSANDPRRAQQRAALTDPGAAERDLIGIVVTGTGAGDDRLRATFRVAADQFAAVLVGKDGGEKRRADRPMPAETLFETIDAMPMARQERSARQSAP